MLRKLLTLLALVPISLLAGVIFLGAQSGIDGGVASVQIHGAITPGDCAEFYSAHAIEDSGGACGGGSGSFNALTGDATSTSTGGATTVLGINGTLLSGLASGILYNTTSTGVPSIATAAQVISALGATPIINASAMTNFPTFFSALTGDAVSTSTGGSTTVKGINGTLLSGLATGPLYNTTTTGVPSIETAAQAISALGATPAINCSACTSIPAGAFSSITGGTNTAALVVGTGGSLAISGSGTIAATSVATTVSSTNASFSILAAASTSGSQAPVTISGFTINPSTSAFSTNGTISTNGNIELLGSGGGAARVQNTGAFEFSSAANLTTADTVLCRAGAAGVVSVESAASCTNTVAGGTGTVSMAAIDVGVINQQAASNTGGTCAMVSATSCTITINHSYTTPVCIATQQSATLTGVSVGCTVSGTTVTITATTSNSETWGALVFGNPT